ncbi:hypothetical protein GCM10028774_03590 [Spirosoma jeollabukense]
MNRIKNPIGIIGVLIALLLGILLVYALTEYESLFDPILDLFNDLKPKPKAR